MLVLKFDWAHIDLEVDFEFVGDFDGPSLGVKFRIAVVPPEDGSRVLRQTLASQNSARAKYELYKQARSGM